MDMCYLACAYRAPSGHCGSTGGAATCPHRQKKKTNADRLRSMSDEELAEYLDGVCHDLWQMFVKDPKKMWLDWLKQEAK